MTHKGTTEEQLEELVLAADREALFEMLAPLNESQRKSLSEAALSMAVSMNRHWGPGGNEGDCEDEFGCTFLAKAEKRKQKYKDWRDPRWAVNLAIPGLCDLKVMTKSVFGWLSSDLRGHPEELLRVLVDRKPKWINGWLEYQYKQEIPILCTLIERGLMRSGVIPTKYDADYYKRFNKLADEDDTEFHENEVWGLFEHDSVVFRSENKEWHKSLLKRCEEEKLDRQRILKSSLDGTLLPLSPSTRNGIGKFHELLTPTLEERLELLENYLAMLDADESTVVGHGLKALDALLKAKRLDGKRYFAAMPNVFKIDKKAQPSKALKIAKALVKREPELEKNAVVAHHPGPTSLAARRTRALPGHSSNFENRLARRSFGVGNIHSG